MEPKHIIYVTPAESSGYIQDQPETRIPFGVKPVFYLQLKDKKYKLRFDHNNNLCIRAHDFDKINIKEDGDGFPTLVIEGK